MPRIDAATVAEHRQLKRAEVVANAVALFAESGADAVTPAAVAKASGLARSSVYQYFPTSGELVAAAVEELFARSIAHVKAAGGAPRADCAARLTAYLHALVEVAEEGHVSQVARFAAAASGLPEPCQQRLRDLHDELTFPLRDIAVALGVARPDLVLPLARGVVNQLPELLATGASPSEVVAATRDFLLGGFARLPADPQTVRSGAPPA